MDFFNNKVDWLDKNTQVDTLIKGFLEPTYMRTAVIGLNSDYGTGKSTFIKMCKEKIDRDSIGLKSVYIDVSESEFENSPVFTILNAIVRESIENPNEKESEIIRLGELALELTSGINFIECRESKNKLKELLLRDKSILKQRFKKYLEDLIEVKVVIFLDDIDRCSPFFAIRILEELKSYFKMIDNLIFVVAYDREQLESFIRKKFGSEMDTNGYLIKFFDTNYLFSSPVEDEFEKFLDGTKNSCITHLGMLNTDEELIVNLIFETIYEYREQFKFNTLRSIQQAIFRLIFGLKRILIVKPTLKIGKKISNTLIILMFLRERNWKLYSDLYKNKIDGLDVSFNIIKDKNFQGIIENIYAFNFLLAYNIDVKTDNDLISRLDRNISRCIEYEEKIDFENINYEKNTFSDVLQEFKDNIDSYENPNIIVKTCLDILEYD